VEKADVRSQLKDYLLEKQLGRQDVWTVCLTERQTFNTVSKEGLGVYIGNKQDGCLQKPTNNTKFCYRLEQNSMND